MSLRHQGDGKGDAVSSAGQRDFSSPKVVRPEFGPETDIKTILRRHGGIPAPTRQPVFTETDYSEDLTSAIGKLKTAHEAFDALPEKHRKKFKNAAELWRRYRDDNIHADAAAEAAAEAAEQQKTVVVPETTVTPKA